MADGRIAAVEDVPEADSLLFRVEETDTGQQREAILLREGEAVVAWQNHCQHFTDVAIDKGSGAPWRNGEVVCTNHGALFDVGTGLCTHGPCEGAVLDGIDVRVEDGEVRMDDSDFRYVGRGPIDDGDDLSSTSNVEF